MSATGEVAPKRLESEIDRRQAELRTAEHGCRSFEIVADVGADRVDVTPGSLDRIVEIDGAASAGLEQAINGPDRSIRGLRGLPPITRPLGERDFRPLPDELHRLGEVPEQAVASRGRLGRRFREGELGERILGDPALIAR